MYDHTINLEDDQMPPYCNIYPLSGTELRVLCEFLDDMLSKGFIRASNSPVGALVLFAKKKDGTLRLCVNFRKLNRITRRDQYPIPLITNLINQLGSAQIYTKFDLRAGYYNVCIAAGHEWKTTFRTHYSSFKFLVMPMGLTNAPATFQHFMNNIFQDMSDLFIVVYLDDILVFSNLVDEHHDRVQQVLTRLGEHNLHVKPEKSLFHTKSIEFLGFMVSPTGISMDITKTKAILNWPMPTNVKQIQSFVGFANFYQRFIVNFSETVTPLTRLTQKEAPCIWGPEQQAAFDTLKLAFTQAPILSHFNPNNPIVIETDASDYAIAAIISQISLNDGDLHP